MLSVLCAPLSTENEPALRIPRFHDALQVCLFTLGHTFHLDNRLRIDIPIAEAHRLQSLIYTTGNIRQMIHRTTTDSIGLPTSAAGSLNIPVAPLRQGPFSGVSEYILALEIALRPLKAQRLQPKESGATGSSSSTKSPIDIEFTARDLLVSICVAGMASASFYGQSEIQKIARNMGLSDVAYFSRSILEGRFPLMEAVHAGGDGL